MQVLSQQHLLSPPTEANETERLRNLCGRHTNTCGAVS